MPTFDTVVLSRLRADPALAPLHRSLDVYYGSPARDRAMDAVQEVIRVLQSGDNVMLWPSGVLTHDGTEKLGGARTTADVLAAVPNVTVVRVRTRGLFGSSLSYAYTGGRPKMIEKFIKGALWLLANGILFGPRRHVELTVDPAFENRGIGAALMRRCIDAARDERHALVLLVGDVPYYARFGFVRVPPRQLELPGPVNPDRFLALELEKGILGTARGPVLPKRSG